MSMQDIKDKAKGMRHAKLRSFGHKGHISEGADKYAKGGIVKRAHGGRVHRDIGGGLHDDDIHSDMHMDGGPSPPRGDRKGRGNTVININVAKPDAAAPPPMPPPMAPPMPPPGPPPMAGPPPMGGMPPPGMMPPPGAMPPRPPMFAKGGRVHRKAAATALRKEAHKEGESVAHEAREWAKGDTDDKPHKQFGGGLGAARRTVRALPPAVAARIPPKPAIPVAPAGLPGPGAMRSGIPRRAPGPVMPPIREHGGRTHKQFGGAVNKGFPGGAQPPPPVQQGQAPINPLGVHYPPWNNPPPGPPPQHPVFPQMPPAAPPPAQPQGQGIPTNPIDQLHYFLPNAQPTAQWYHNVGMQVPPSSPPPASPSGTGMTSPQGGIPRGDGQMQFGNLVGNPNDPAFQQRLALARSRGLQAFKEGGRIQHDGYDDKPSDRPKNKYGETHGTLPAAVVRARGGRTAHDPGHVELDAGSVSGEGRLEKRDFERKR